MAAYVLHMGATVVCLHSGQAQPVTTNSRVKVGGQPIVTQTDTYTISGCILPSPPNGNGPCATAQFLSGATRVTAGNIPLLLQNSQATCAPSLTGLNVIQTQVRVKAT
jgi:uncharacterized Zn-binding protein involved in type VI secretion